MIGIPRATLMDRTESAAMSTSWGLQDAVETYGVRHWGKGYFGINGLGHVTVHPDKTERSIDLIEDCPRGGKGLGQTLAHPDGLAALPGKHERDRHPRPL